MNKNLLIEIGVEELPALPLLKELPNIEKKWIEILKNYKLESEFKFYYTPRRLVFFHQNFKERQDDSFVEFIGAPKNIAYKDGKLSNAGLSFLQKAGISEEELEFKEIKGKEVLYYKKYIQGQKSQEILPLMIENFLKSLNFGKSMRWGEYTFEFIRAIRSMVCLLDSKVLEFELYGVKSSNKTFVHRSVSYDLLSFNSIQAYFEILEQNYIILDPEKRKEKILNEFKALEQKHFINIAQDDELLNEVIAITEYPSALLGSFDKNYLEIPKEVIITSMRENQRYFAVFKNEELSNHFIVVSNSVCKDYTQIIEGNERVLRARLSDAMFFWKNDLKTGLNPDKLSYITYLENLGSMKDKSLREEYIAEILCEIYNNPNTKDIKTAIKYSKADLNSQMVYEFTNLQGIMGSYYAKAMGFNEAICLAIKEQYLPDGENSKLPSNEFSSIVSLANKLDTLLGLFSIGKLPNGSKDPYALRRAASGVLKIILNTKKDLDLDDLFSKICKNYKEFDIQILKDFIFERLYTFYEVNASFIKAVLSSKNTNIIYINNAIKALIKISQKENFSENFSTFKRLANIASKPKYPLEKTLFTQEEENKLYEAFLQTLNFNDVEEKLDSLFALKPLIDNFFDKVMINVDDEKIKNNRQALVYQIYSEFLKIADIKEVSL
ncbi:glycine--tRNA ligase subunit beta [Campylobacter novaezeelandiae]|uniref:glycine--tRNA ligase subunit beta n=1 Tax=Campylobacter novaezeelandiae TaxID=2267891 RepID=UPI00103723B0|nr:glycine--tRNA ligase subunit beta [Campylobacter novaezeelandiae]QWU79841.1 glycyl-tRNA synthetase, beta chain [Campylobacter novaezeelandiae]TBR80870.1 glycine--tRNA ligase subunit beta [Campylobacter novaezeelandiae]